MNYIKTFCITTILLGAHDLYNQEEPLATTEKTTVQEDAPATTTATTTEIATKTEVASDKKNEKTEWTDHLTLLKTAGKYWNASQNIPEHSWTEEALSLAKKILNKDTSLAATIKSEFYDVIQEKIAIEKGKFAKESTFPLIEKFDKAIDDYITSLEKKVAPAEKKETPTSEPQSTPIIEVQPEPIIETTTAPATTPTSTTSTSAATAKPSEAAAKSEEKPKELKAEWKELLENIASGDDPTASIERAYTVAQELLLAGGSKDLEKELEANFYNALETRMVQKNVSKNTVNRAMNSFKESVGVTAAQKMPVLPPEMAMKEMSARANLERQKKELEKKEMLATAVAEKLKEQDRVNNPVVDLRIHEMEKKLQERKLAIENKEKEIEEESKNIRETYAQNMKRMAQEQKAAAEKGIFSRMTEGLTDWWYGTGAQKQAQAVHAHKEQSDVITKMVSHTHDPIAAKKTFEKFQNMLLNFNIAEFSDPNNSIIRNKWNKIIYKIVIVYGIMPLKELSSMIKNVLGQLGTVPQTSIKKIVHEMTQKTAKKEQELFAQQKYTLTTTEALIERRKEQQRELELEQQRIRDEEKRKKDEAQRKETTQLHYKNNKKEWNDLLLQVAQHKQATPHENHSHTKKAVEKSQSLLQLAGNIPTKNKNALSQKLKQKFSVALLEQQKNNEQSVNIHHHMDMFNNEINKLAD